MQNLINYIIDILNIKVNSTFTITDMETELSKVDDLGKYRIFIRDNLKHMDVDYQSGFQKFIILTKKYLDDQEKEKLPHHTANTFTDKIIQKIGQYKVQLKNAIEQGQQAPLSRATIRKDDEVEKLFSDTEIKALAALKVSSSSIIEMYEVGILKDNLINVFMKYHLDNVNNKALSDGEKKVKVLLGGVK